MPAIDSVHSLNKVRYTLKKQEILRSRKEIKELFKNGSSFFWYPYKFIYRINTNEEKRIKVLFTVPAKQFRKAVDRNKIRRRIREAYRLHKQMLTEDVQENFSITLCIIYISKFKLPFSEMEDKLKKAFVRLKRTEINTST
jgi:ribonuclease P protein component